MKKFDREKVENFAKVFTMLFTMILGFFFVYALAWVWVGLPLTKWAAAICLALAVLSEYGFYRWCLK